MYLVLGAGVAIALTLGYWRANRRGPGALDAPDQARQVVGDVIAAPPAPPPPAVDPEAAQRAALARAKAEQKALLDRAASVRAKLTQDFPAEHAQWLSVVVPLLTDDRGKSIAASEAYAQAFFREYQAERPTPDAVASLASQLSFLLPPLQDAFQNPASVFVPDTTFRTTLDGFARQADEAVASYRTHREAIERILRLAQAEHPTPTGPALADAVRERQDHAEADRLAAEHTRFEQDRVHEQARTADELERAREETNAQERAREEAARAAAARQRELLRKANDPEILRAFAPFLARKGTRIGSANKYVLGEHPGAFTDIEHAGGFVSPEKLVKLGKYPDDGNGRRPKGNPERLAALFEDFEPLARIWVTQCKLLQSAEDAGKPCTPQAP
jgi:hypothetical protein